MRGMDWNAGSKGRGRSRRRERREKLGGEDMDVCILCSIYAPDYEELYQASNSATLRSIISEFCAEQCIHP